MESSQQRADQVSPPLTDSAAGVSNDSVNTELLSSQQTSRFQSAESIDLSPVELGDALTNTITSLSSGNDVVAVNPQPIVYTGAHTNVYGGDSVFRSAGAAGAGSRSPHPQQSPGSRCAFL
ncbi:hypothetical protein M8J77_025264 [Diaphorina citri]|nr:hypothetical protein M8J77_001484 [Diaphorina citri]KAI5720143.1 hypothetical protein M8J77_002537 [Diaphorina citri]KAI5720212.1 hypothetical protein M8J77_003445 [Diaphorina citri]KAI5720916.1 hypothetical protein M8J77_013189 [Diaphorina citri]KAI5721207.1 hypothetical protein M8J77_017502 [Diaphorina citri]